MDILKIAAEQFLGGIGDKSQGLDVGKVVGALGGLLGGSTGKLDLSSLVGMMRDGGLSTIVASWLGNGPNAAISPEAVGRLFSAKQLSGFASGLNLDTQTVTQGLAAALPALIDKSSDGGNLLDNARGALGALSKMF